MDTDTIKAVTEILHNVSVICATLVGGWWVRSQNRIQRINETRLGIDLKYSVSDHQGHKNLMLFEVVLTNDGKSKLEACRREYDEKGNPAYIWEDEKEKITYALRLEVKHIKKNSTCISNWFDDDGLEDITGIPKEINLLEDYEVRKENVPGFYLEPGEIYHFTSLLSLDHGLYMAKVSFLGKKSDEFWARQFFVDNR